MIHEITIHSKDPQKLFSFCSFLFDIEDANGNEDVSFDYDGVRFVILEGETSSNNFSLQAQDRHELENLKNSVEFFSYKEGLITQPLCLDESSLVFKDFENREWKVVSRH